MKTKDYQGWNILETEKNFYNNFNEYSKLGEIIETYVKQKDCVLQVGANYGFETKFLAEKFNTVHTFDFDNDVSACFTANMKKHNIENIVQHLYGLGDTEQLVAISKNENSVATHIDLSGNDKKYQIKRLDDLNVEKVNMIIIDTEGYEYFVLSGGEHTIKKHMPVMIIEFHKRELTEKFFNYESKKTDKYLKRLGYKYICNTTKNDRLYIPAN